MSELSNPPLVSIVTVTFNSEDSIAGCLHNLENQTYKNIQHIIIDGDSLDKTISIIKREAAESATIISEPDSGIYDALNKGFSLARGEIIGILHSDDLFAHPRVVADVVDIFLNQDTDFVYGNVEFVNYAGITMRHWRAPDFDRSCSLYEQIPHTSMFIKREIACRINPPFDPSYKISGDIKHQLLLTHVLGAEGIHLDETLVRMRLGGTSTANICAYFSGWVEARRAWNEVFGAGGLRYTILKVLLKLSQTQKIRRILRRFSC